MNRRTHLLRPAALAVMAALALAACDAPAPTVPATPGAAQATRRGLPTHDALFRATGLPAGTVYGVARTATGFRVLYHSGAGPAQTVARNLCATLGRAPGTIRNERIDGQGQIPGARKIAIDCVG